MQADPVEDSIPARSSRNNSESPSHPGKVKWALPGSRPWPGAPRSTASGTAARTPSISRSRRAAMRCRFLRKVGGHGLGRRGKGCNGGGVQGPGADVPFLSPAVLHRGQLHGAAQHQRPDADRAADLVPRDGHGVQPGGAEIHRHGAEGLDGVGVDRNAGPVRQLDDLRHWLDAADFVVGPHHRDQGDRGGVPGQLGRQHGQVHDAVRIHRQPSHLGALVPLEPFDGVQHGVVLDGGAQDPRALRVPGVPGPVQAFHGQVVGFGSARGKDDFGGVRPGRGSQHLAGILDGAAGAAARSVE